ncbi:MAG: acyltransferase [Acidimicrobiales bacterium]
MTTPTTSFDHIVSATPVDRDRVVDAMRAGSILVVVLWHWSMSVLTWTDDGSLSMPNPIDSIPGGWLATWILQVMPLFFVVGGYANLTSLHHRSRSLGEFARERARRLILPLLPMVTVWAAADAVGLLLRGDDHRSVLEWGFVVFVPLWFIGVFAAVSMLAPITARLHRQAPLATLAGIAGGVITIDALRFATGAEVIGWINVLLVFTFAHQLGYLWRDGRLTRSAPLLAIGSVVALALMTGFGPYPGSMVATESTALSNMSPTTAPIAAVAVLQWSLTMLAAPTLRRVLARAAVWRAVVIANVGAMKIFTWHMTALVLFLGLWSSLGLDLLTEPTGAWWLGRPIWVVGPGLVLTAIVAMGRRLAPRWIGIPVIAAATERP